MSDTKNPLRKLPNQIIAVQLLVWSLLWMAAGLVGLWVLEDLFWRSFLFFSGVWGVVNSTIAIVGLLGSVPDAQRLHRILVINYWLDVLYVVVGIVLALLGGQMLRGFGGAIVLQGFFLFVFDLLHARSIQRSMRLDGS